MKLLMNEEQSVCYTDWEMVARELERLYVGDLEWLAIECLNEASPYWSLRCTWEDGENSTVELCLREQVGVVYRQYCYGLDMVAQLFRQFDQGEAFDLSQWVPTPTPKAAVYAEPAETTVAIAPSLKRKINQQLRRPAYTAVTKGELQSLTQLDCAGLGVREKQKVILDISYLVLADNLQSLDLSHNFLVGAYGLERVFLALTKLTALNLSGTNLANLWPLRRMGQLTTLVLRDCPDLVDVEGLRVLPQLKFVEASEDLIAKFGLREMLPQVVFNSLRAEEAEDGKGREQWLAQVSAAVKKGQWAQAVQAYEHLLDESATWELYKSAAYCAKMWGDGDREEVYLERGLSHFPAEDQVETLLDLYHKRYQYQKALALAEVCLQGGKVRKTALEVRRDCQWHLAGNGISQFGAKGSDETDSESFGQLLAALRATWGQDEALPEEKVVDMGALDDGQYFAAFFYDDFTRVWHLRNTSMRPVYRGCLKEILQCALTKTLYQQEEGTTDYHIAFAEEVSFIYQAYRRNMSWRDFYWFLRTQINRYCERYKPIPSERDNLWQKLEELRQMCLLPLLDEAPLADFLQTEAAEAVRQEWLKTVRERLDAEKALAGQYSSSQELLQAAQTIDTLLERGALYTAVVFVERFEGWPSPWQAVWRGKVYLALNWLKAAEQALLMGYGLDRESPALCYNLGRFYLLTENYQAAYNFLLQAFMLRKQDYETFIPLAQAALALGELEQASQFAAKGQEAARSEDERRQAQTILDQAALALVQRQIAKGPQGNSERYH